jgi:hypothetical protein
VTLPVNDFRWGLIKDDLTREVIQSLALQVATVKAGSVTSVGLSAPLAVFSVGNSPVTGAGTLALSFATQAANLMWSGPASGAAAVPTFRAMVLADVPDGTFTADAAGRAKFADLFVNTAKIGAAAVTKPKLAGGFMKQSLIAGAAAGNHTVTGIAVGDEIVSVIRWDAATPDLFDDTAEYTITGANTINNAAGTSSAGQKLLVAWCDLT